MITALVVDDEPRAVSALADLLETFPGMDVIGTARDVGDAERFLAGRSPDVVFLDIDMPGRVGFDLVPSVPATTRIVFVTAHDARSLDAFRVGAVDYLLKPVDRDRLAITIERLEAWVPAARLDDASGGPSAGRGGDGDDRSQTAAGMVRLVFTGDRGSETVPLADIIWVEGVRNYTRVQLRDREPGMVRRTMAEWEAILPAAAFGRISRSLIIQLAAIRATQWQSRLQTLLFFHGVEDALPLGRAGTTRLKELVQG